MKQIDKDQAVRAYANSILEFTIIVLIASMITIVVVNPMSTGVYWSLAVIGAAILAIPNTIRKLGA